MSKLVKLSILYATGIFLVSSPSMAGTREYTLTIEEKVINIGGKPFPSMTINGSVPGPTLYFVEGDTAVIRVINRMKVSTSIHWHGVLVPPGMDGVPYVSFPPIEPGDTFTYTFPIRQSGTYWYHSHTGLQEQRGVYGSIVIHSGEEERDYDREYVVVFSDWIYENPDQVLRTLKAGREWYPIKKGKAQSLFGAIKSGMLGHFIKRELLRMPPMDISDIAYDHFLTNGKIEDTLKAHPGERIRLRIINASAGTNFLVDFSAGPMKVISADGIDVQPFDIERLFIAIAETYDVIVTVPDDGSFQLRATAQDNSGSTSLWIGEGRRHYGNAIPDPNLYYTMGEISLNRILALKPQDAMGMSDRAVKEGRFDKPGMIGMEMAPMKKRGMHMDKDSKLVIDGMDPRRPWAPYMKLKSTEPFEPDTSRIRTIRLTLDGDMERYVWMLNGKPLSAGDSIHIRKGEIVRFILINRTMMHHPMHLHGHFFRVINQNGEYSPWKHTVDVPPMSTVVIEFPANEVGDWFFHCHLLYHMKSGMARVVHYEEYEPPANVRAVRSNLYKDHWFYWAETYVWSNMSEGYINASSTFFDVNVSWDVRWMNLSEPEQEINLYIKRYFNRFFKIFFGVNGGGTMSSMEYTYPFAGMEYLLPLNVKSFAWVDWKGGYRFVFSKEIPLLSRFILEGEMEYDSREGMDYTIIGNIVLTRRVFLSGNYDSESGAGIGLNFWF